jgi:hypothetical protein
VAQAVFFIPIITPTVIASPYCRFELDAFLAREAALGRSDLVFPILYIHVPALEDSVRRQNDAVLSLISKRQYVDWREFRHLDSNSTEVKRAVERFCGHIRDALYKPWLSPEERKQQEEAAALERAEAERRRQAAEAKRRAEEEAARQRIAEQVQQKREVELERNRIAALEAEAREEDVRHRRQAEEGAQREAVRPSWIFFGPRLGLTPWKIAGLSAIVAVVCAVVVFGSITFTHPSLLDKYFCSDRDVLQQVKSLLNLSPDSNYPVSQNGDGYCYISFMDADGKPKSVIYEVLGWPGFYHTKI